MSPLVMLDAWHFKTVRRMRQVMETNRALAAKNAELVEAGARAEAYQSQLATTERKQADMADELRAAREARASLQVRRAGNIRCANALSCAELPTIAAPMR